MQPSYKPYTERTPDMQYLEAIRRLRSPEARYTKTPFQEYGTFTHLSLSPLVYRLENGFPILTERAIPFWRKPISELIAFINGATTLDEMRHYGDEKTWASWWANWVYEEKCAIFGLPAGDLGPGSYGGILAKCPTPNGHFHQVKHLLKQMRDYPDIRTHMVTTWYAPYALQHKELKRKVVVAPCHGTVMKFTIIDGKLTYQHVQRSIDFPVGGVLNIIQHATLLLMVAQVLGIEPYEYIHYPIDSQIYENQIEMVDELLLKREPRPFPTLVINDPTIRDLFAFRPEHFTLTNYDPHPVINFPVTE